MIQEVGVSMVTRIQAPRVLKPVDWVQAMDK